MARFNFDAAQADEAAAPTTSDEGKAVAPKQNGKPVSSGTPKALKTGFSVPRVINTVAMLIIIVPLVLGTFGIPLPIDPAFRSLGVWFVTKVVRNSMTTLGYTLPMLLVALAIIVNALGKRK